MTSDASAPVLAALQALEYAAESHPAGLAGVQTHIIRLQTCVQNILQRHSALELSLDDRRLAENALKNVIANKEAEIARVLSEVSRLRRNLQLTADAQDPAAADAGCILEPAARQAVLAAAVAAKDKPTAAITQLESQVGAQQARIAALEAESAAAAAEHASRLSEQQKSFLSKLEQLRHVHGQQLALQQEQTVKQQSRCQELEAQLAAAHSQQQQQQVVVDDLQQQLQRVQGQLEGPQPKQEAPVVNNHAAHPVSNCGPCEGMSSSGQHCAGSIAEQLDHTCCRQAPCASHQQVLPSPAAALSNSSAADDTGPSATMLQVMEGQLTRLSEIIRSQQAEIDQLRQALTAGCAERQQLQQQLQQVQQQQQQAPMQQQQQAPMQQQQQAPIQQQLQAHPVQGHKPIAVVPGRLPSPSLGISSNRHGSGLIRAKVTSSRSGSSTSGRV